MGLPWRSPGGVPAGSIRPPELSMVKQPDDLFAMRTLEVDGVPCFHLRLFKPSPEDGGAYWRCRYTIDGPLTRHGGSQCGIDGMQALLHAVYILGVEAELSAENVAGRLAWDGQSKHFGFPSGDADPGRAELIRLARQRPSG